MIFTKKSFQRNFPAIWNLRQTYWKVPRAFPVIIVGIISISYAIGSPPVIERWRNLSVENGVVLEVIVSGTVLWVEHTGDNISSVFVSPKFPLFFQVSMANEFYPRPWILIYGPGFSEPVKMFELQGESWIEPSSKETTTLINKVKAFANELGAAVFDSIEQSNGSPTK